MQLNTWYVTPLLVITVLLGTQPSVRPADNQTKEEAKTEKRMKEEKQDDEASVLPFPKITNGNATQVRKSFVTSLMVKALSLRAEDVINAPVQANWRELGFDVAPPAFSTELSTDSFGKKLRLYRTLYNLTRLDLDMLVR
jgi:hypothetical protein